MMRTCGGCGRGVNTLGEKATHPWVDETHVLCGWTGKRVLTYAEGDVPAIGAHGIRNVRAMERVEEFATALAFHQQHEGAPVEVNTEGGWVEATALLTAVAEALREEGS